MNFGKYILYVCDVETTALSGGDIIEIALHRMSDDASLTLFMRAVNEEKIERAALRVNGYLLEDITWKTKVGKEKFLDPAIALSKLENFLLDDGVSAEERILVGQNIQFDFNYIKACYEKNADISSFPFGKLLIDTMMIEFLFDLISGNVADSYSLHHLTKKYSIKNEKSHTAFSDTIATKDLFLKQIEKIKKLYAKLS